MITRYVFEMHCLTSYFKALLNLDNSLIDLSMFSQLFLKVASWHQNGRREIGTSLNFLNHQLILSSYGLLLHSISRKSGYHYASYDELKFPRANDEILLAVFVKINKFLNKRSSFFFQNPFACKYGFCAKYYWLRAYLAASLVCISAINANARS